MGAGLKRYQDPFFLFNNLPEYHHFSLDFVEN